ncbi:MAG: hypothetical protein HRT92_11620 [Piscirickettsiaceae bacterium]|nr:hypothetical protein [Piscirickettsiaceae bacterium]
MPSQHIKDETWKKVEKEAVRAVIQTKTHIRPTEILDLLVMKGLEVIDEVDYDKLARTKQ